MPDKLPAPGAQGYQPGIGEGFTYVDVTVGGEQGRLSGRYVFPSPRPTGEAVPALAEAIAQLGSLLTAVAVAKPAATVPPPPAPSTAPQPQTPATPAVSGVPTLVEPPVRKPAETLAARVDQINQTNMGPNGPF